jgi:hypothetical protein
MTAIAGSAPLRSSRAEAAAEGPSLGAIRRRAARYWASRSNARGGDMVVLISEGRRDSADTSRGSARGALDAAASRVDLAVTTTAESAGAALRRPARSALAPVRSRRTRGAGARRWHLGSMLHRRAGDPRSSISAW